MDREYEKIEKISTEIYEWYRAMLLKERLLYGEIAELFIEAVKPLGGHHKGAAYHEMALSTLSTRFFDDAEGAKRLLLYGLPSQARIVVRDIIECTMLFRLFLRKPELAKSWLMESKEYHLGDVNAKLLEMSIHAREYAFYGLLSHEGHSNLLASLSNIQEKEVEEGMLRTFHFGSSRTSETIYFVQQGFLTLFFLLHISLIEPLAEFYSQHSDIDSFKAWAQKVDNLFPKLEALVNEINKRNGKKETQLDKHIYKLVGKKLRVKEFEERLSGGDEM